MMNLNRTSNLAALALSATLVVTAVPAQQDAPSQPNYQNADSQNQDPPSRVARISVAQGNVSLDPAGVDTFSQAELNYPLTAGDRVYADNNSMAELQTVSLAVRMGNGADLTLSSLTDQTAQFGLAQGSIRLRTRDLRSPDGEFGVVEIDTPNGTIVVQQTGDIRVDSYPQDDTTVVTVSSGQVQITGPNLDTTLGQGQSLRLAGTNPVYTQPLRLLAADQLDNFDQTREREREQSLRVSAQYADPEIVGFSDLAQNGDWNPNPEYGNVWFPRAVPAGWTPYSNGHWAWVAPWGWTWIEAESWGFAPFHYGRWAQFQGRWGWVPGPPPSVYAGERAPRPVYSPALVAFVGGPRLSISIGFGGSSGAGVTAWFPLGPREAYQPWYHASPAYVNRVNVTNIYNRNVTEIHNTYLNKTTNVYHTNITNVTFVNRPAATVAVAQRDFASGHDVAQSRHIRMDQNTQRQLAQAPILPHPLVTPGAGAASPQAPARAVPPNQARPVVETRQGLERAGNPDSRPQPGRPETPQQPPMNQNQPVRVPNQPVGTQTAEQKPPMVHGQPLQMPNQPVATQTPPQTPAQRPPMVHNQPMQLPNQPIGRQPVAPGTPVVAGGQNRQGGFRGNFPQQRDHAPVTPGQPPVVQTPAPPPPQPLRTFGPGNNGLRPQPSPAPVAPPMRTAPPAQSAPVPLRPVQPPPLARPPLQAHPGHLESSTPAPAGPVQRAPEVPRPLINRSQPQPVQPSFPQQQRAIQAADPGRPLGPQQVQNLRLGHPAGPATQPEPVAHPPAANPRPDRTATNPKAPK